ncbi:MAG TPA: filamentous hemagglutinin N-terminal domain-containing protein [Limnobacter sp.]|nr:filamentous hemagglutinin N-terminal domain-containing protein [Limnobacter sp.]
MTRTPFKPSLLPMAHPFSLRPLAAFTMMMFASQAMGLPSLDNAGGGSGVVVDLLNPSTLRVTQSNARAVANWSNFDIAVGETVRIEQPNGQAVLLNRISSQNASEIFGNLEANGRVFLINPKGIVFGPSAQVDVGGLVASTLALRPGFQGQGNDLELEALADSGSIVNQGHLRGNDIALIAPTVENRGNVEASAGRVHVLAASAVTVNTASEFMVFQVEAGHESAVIDQLGQINSSGGEIFLLARAAGTGAASVINVEGIHQANRLTIQGDTVMLSGPDFQVADTNMAASTIAIAGLSTSGNLHIDAGNTTQTAAVVVGGQTNLRNGNAALNHADNDFVGQVVLHNAGQVSVQDANNLTLTGTGGQTTARAATQLTANNLSVSSLDAQGSAVALGELRTTGNLTVAAVDTSQTAAIVVGGQTAIVGGRADLNHADNDFVGLVALQNSGPVNLNDINNLTVTGGAGQASLQAADQLRINDFSATHLDVQAAEAALAGLLVVGDLTVQANTTTQTGGVAVGGQTTLMGGDATLDHLTNNFGDVVTLQNAGQVSLRDSNQLTVSGNVVGLDVVASQQLNIVNLNANSLDVHANQVVISGLSTQGDFHLNAGVASQTTAITVGGQSALRGGTLILDNAGNNFVGQVAVEGADQVSLRDAGDLSVMGSVGDLTAVAGGQLTVNALGTGGLNAQGDTVLIHGLNSSGNFSLNANTAAQTAAIEVRGQTTLQGGVIALNHANNDFAGPVLAPQVDQLTLRDRNDLVLGASNIRGDLVLDASLGIAQTAAITVGGQTTLQGANVNLNQAGNDFAGRVVLQNAGQVSMRDSNNLTLSGTADEVTAQANAVALGELATVGDLTLNADGVTQTDAITVGGQTTIQQGSVSLDDAGNDFVGQVLLQDAGQVSLRDINSLTIAGNAAHAEVHANHQLRVDQVAVDSLQAQANSIVLAGLQSRGDVALQAVNTSQTEAFTVGGQTTLQGGNATLNHAGNDFSGLVQMQGAGNVNLQGQNTLTVAGDANALALQSTTLQIQGVRVQQDMVIEAQQTTQTGALEVGRQLTLAGGDATLNRQDNRLEGLVRLNATGQAALASQTRVQVQGQTDALQTSMQSDLQLADLRASTLQVQAQAVDLSSVQVLGDAQIQAAALTQSGSLQVDGRLNLQGGEVSLRDTNNRLGSAVVLNHSGDVALATQGQLNVQGSVLGDLEANAPSIAQAQALSVAGRTTLRGGAANLTQSTNQFGGGVVLDGLQQADLRDIDTLRLSGRVDTLHARATDLITQDAALRVDGQAHLFAQQIDLRNPGNQFAGPVHGQARQADIRAQGELALDVQGLEQLRVHADSVHLVQANTDGNLEIQAERVTQAAALRVGGDFALQGGEAILLDAGNDFQGLVTFNGVRHASLHDANRLSVAGQVSGVLNLQAAQVEQHAALSVGNRVVVSAEDVRLTHAGNQLANMDLSDSRRVAVRSTSNTQLTADGRLASLDVQGQQVSLGELGRVETLTVTASRLEQQAALDAGNVQVTSPVVRLDNPGNHIDGVLSLTSPHGGVVDAAVASQGDLTVAAQQLVYRGDVQGDLIVRAASLHVGDVRVQGHTDWLINGAVSQSGPVNLQSARIQAAELDLRNSANDLNGTVVLQVAGLSALGASGDLAVDATANPGELRVRAGGDFTLLGNTVVLGESEVQGNLSVRANALSQTGALQVGGHSNLDVVGGAVALAHLGNRLNGEVQANADVVNLFNGADLRLRGLLAREGRLESNGRVLLLGDVHQGAGTLHFVAHHRAMPLSSADLGVLLPASLDVFSNREVVDPITGLGRVFVAGAAIEQRGGTITSEAGADMRFHASNNGSVVLARANRMQGSLSVLAGQSQSAYAYLPANGASLVAVNNEIALRVAAPGVEADLIAIRANGLSTQPGSILRARMPYNDFGVGAARSFPALTLSVPMPGNPGMVSDRGVVPFGEPGLAAGPNPRAVQVSVGETDLRGLGGFMTVLPFEGAALLPGQVIHLAGPGQSGVYNFFYDGAGSVTRIPVSYNGTVLLSPQETAALTSAQGAVVLARQEQTRSVVRTENVAGKVIQGVVVEVGPGRPATVGSGEVNKPASCDASDQSLSCAP